MLQREVRIIASSSRGAMADKESPEEIETLKTKGTHEGTVLIGNLTEINE